MQTSIDFLLNELLQNKLLALRYDQDGVMDEIVAKAKEMHEKEVKGAYRFGLQDEFVIGSEQYYNKIYKKVD